MYNLKKNKLYLFIFLVTTVVNSQTKENISLDSFKKNLASIKQIDSSIVFTKSILKKTKETPVLLEAYSKLASFYYKKKRYTYSKQNTLKAIFLAKKINNKERLSLLYMLLGYIDIQDTDRDQALTNFNKGLTIAKEINYNEGIYKLLDNIAKLYRKEGDTVKALATYKKSLFYGKKTNQNLRILTNNIGVLFLTQQKDSAISYFKKSLQLSEKTNSDKGKCLAHTNLGHTYLRYDASGYPKAFDHLKKAEKLVVGKKNGREIYYINFYLGVYYEKIGNPKLAETYYKKVLNSSAGEKDIVQKIKALKQIASFYESEAKFNIALKYDKEYHTIKDQMYSVEKNKAFNNIRTKYEVAEKDNKINLLAKENELSAIHRKNIITSFLAVFIILLLLILFYRKGLKNQKKIRTQENLLFNAKQEKLEKEKELKKVQGYIDGQEKEKNRIALELHDGIAGELAGIKHFLNAYNTNTKDTQLLKATADIALITKEVRSLSHTLSSDYILNTSFTNLILELKNKLANNNTTEINITIFPENAIDILNNHIKHNLYRILQEILTNALKHAQATCIDVSFTIHSQYISLLIDDNGIGFDKNPANKGIGFANIKKRINSLQGKLNIDSVVGRGTTIAIEIPLLHAENKNNFS